MGCVTPTTTSTTPPVASTAAGPASTQTPHDAQITPQVTHPARAAPPEATASQTALQVKPPVDVISARPAGSRVAPHASTSAGAAHACNSAASASATLQPSISQIPGSIIKCASCGSVSSQAESPPVVTPEPARQSSKAPEEEGSRVSSGSSSGGSGKVAAAWGTSPPGCVATSDTPEAIRQGKRESSEQVCLWLGRLCRNTTCWG
jgi:hypothetical protein